MRLSRTAISALSLVVLASGLAACGETGEQASVAEVDAAQDAGEEMGVIKDRQANFKEIGDAFKVVRGQLEGDSPDFALISASAETIQADATKIPGFFPEGTGPNSGADTEALAAIWEKPEEFAAAHQKLVDASAVLVEAAASKDAAAIGAAAKELGGACKNCHDTFRLDDE